MIAIHIRVCKYCKNVRSFEQNRWNKIERRVYWIYYEVKQSFASINANLHLPNIWYMGGCADTPFHILNVRRHFTTDNITRHFYLVFPDVKFGWLLRSAMGDDSFEILK